MNSIYIFPEAIHTEDTISLDLEENGLRFSVITNEWLLILLHCGAGPPR